MTTDTDTDIDAHTRTRAQSLYDAGVQALAAQFDPDRGLLRQTTDDGDYYPTRENLRYARCLLRDGDAGAQERGTAILAAVLAVQEQQPGNIHEGNWPWMCDDGHVTDLNAVQFESEILCHLLLESATVLPAPLRAAARDALALALAEIARLDVDVAYTNICLLDIHNSVLGGRILGLPGWYERGARKLVRWADYTAASGAPREYNSPTYGGVDLTALAALVEYAPDPDTRLLARVMEERLWLHTATHYHAPTAQLAGPHSRAYHNDVTGGRGLLKTTLYQVLGDERLYRRTPFYVHRQGDGNVDVGLATYHCPPAVRALFTDKPLPFSVRETADVAEGLDLSTTLTPEWALGVASRSYSGQSDNLLLTYRKEAAPGFGVLFTRFITNGKRLGSTYNASDRTWVNNLSDEGIFRGLHHRNIAIGVYGLAPQSGNLSRAALDVFVVGHAGLGEVSLGTTPIASLPADIPPGAPLIVEDGDVWIAVRSLRHSNLGRHAPVTLEERDGDLVLSTTIYDGPPKQFWEYRTLDGPFYRGNIESGVIVQVGTRAEFPTAEAFATTLATAQLDEVTTNGVRTIRYRSGGDDLLLRYRLTDMAIIERQVNGTPLLPVALASPNAVQGTGTVTLGGYTLAGADDAAHWLVVSPDSETVTATRVRGGGEPWSLRFPGGEQITITSAGPLRLTYAPRAGTVDVEYVGPLPTITYDGWQTRPTVRTHADPIPTPLPTQQRKGGNPA